MKFPQDKSEMDTKSKTAPRHKTKNCPKTDVITQKDVK